MSEIRGPVDREHTSHPFDGQARSGRAAPVRIGPFTRQRLVVGDWNELLRDPIDVLRAALLVGAFAMAVSGDYSAAVRLTLSFAAVIAARALDLPRTIDLAFTLGISLSGWGNALGLFDAWPWYNKIVHYVLPFGGSATLYFLLARLGVVCDFDHRCHARQALGVAVVTLALGFTAGGFYEVWEWFIHHNLNAPIYVTYDDTITDMIDNALGSLTGGIVLMLWARRGWGTRRKPAPLGTAA